MILHGPDHSVPVRIRITVAAEVAAGVVCADIPSDIAGTFFPVVRNRREKHILPDSAFKNLLRHAAGAVGTDSGQFLAFSAGLDDHAVFPGDFHKRLCEFKLYQK